MTNHSIAVVWPVNGEWRFFRFAKRRFRWHLEGDERVEMPSPGDPLEGAEGGTARVTRLRLFLQRPAWRGLPILLVVRRPRYLFGEVDLPAASAGRLAAMIPFQLERVFPFGMEDLWFSHLDPFPAGEGITVPLFAVPGAAAKDLIGPIEQAGGKVAGILPSAWLWFLRLSQRAPRESAVLAVTGVDGTEIIAVEGGNLRGAVWVAATSGGEAALMAVRDVAARFHGALVQRQTIGESPHEAALGAGMIPPVAGSMSPGDEADLLSPLLASCLPASPAVMTPAGRAGGGARQGSWKPQAILAAAVLVLFGMGAWQRHGRDLAQLDRYHQADDRLAPQMAVLKAVGEERSLLTARSQALDKAIGRMPTMRQVLRELTIIVPDDTWLSEFTCQDNRVTIRGFSGNSSVLLGALEASPLFRQVRFGAPITQDARVQREVFLIQSELEETP